MTVIAEITVPARAFDLGRLFNDLQQIEIELERVVPLQEAIIPLVWISGPDQAEVESRFLADAHIEAVDVLTTTDDQTLYEVRWEPGINGLVGALIDSRARILEASGSAETWDFRLRFESHADLSEFNMAITDQNIPVTLRHLYNPTVVAEGEKSLSAEQRETLLMAYRRGYFEVPRGSTLQELSSEMDISDSALSQRLRRGIGQLIEETLLVEEQSV